LNKFQFSYLF